MSGSKKKDTEYDPALLIPGNELEKAAADVTRAASKSIIGGMEKVLGARFAVWIAENEAKAQAARLAIETKSQLDRAIALTDERRRQELAEIEHEAQKQLAQRRLERLLVEMAREQSNVEAITAQALAISKTDPKADDARGIDEDWMFKFVRYAQDVSDKDIQKIWANVLNSAAVKDRPLLTPAALQMISLFDKQTAIDFEKFCRVYVTLGLFPMAAEQVEQIGLRNLSEHGLITDATRERYSFSDFDLKLGDFRQRVIVEYPHGLMGPTQRGREIGNAVFANTPLNNLDGDLQEKYIQQLIAPEMRFDFTIYPKVGGSPANFVVVLAEKKPEKPKNTEYSDTGLSERLKRILSWAKDNYGFEVVQNEKTGIG